MSSFEDYTISLLNNTEESFPIVEETQLINWITFSAICDDDDNENGVTKSSFPTMNRSDLR